MLVEPRGHAPALHVMKDTRCETAGACSTSTDPSKDGADGSFYCINGGTVGGTAGSGSCTCTSCNTGYEGASCQTASACTASAVSTKDGSDGTFYCVNGGAVGGTTGSCTCTGCNAGYSGTNCQVADACTASTVASKDGSGRYLLLHQRRNRQRHHRGVHVHRVRRRIRGANCQTIGACTGSTVARMGPTAPSTASTAEPSVAPPDRARAQGATQDTAERAVRLPPRAPLPQTQLRMAVTVHFTASTVVLSVDSLVTACARWTRDTKE